MTAVLHGVAGTVPEQIWDAISPNEEQGEEMAAQAESRRRRRQFIRGI